MGVSVKEEGTSQTEAVPQTLEEVMASAVPKLKQVLQKIPPEKLAEAKKEADVILSGDLSWADLSQYTPERLLQIAEVGYNQFKIGKYDSSERIFKGLTVIDPSNYYYHQMLGATFQRLGKQPEAIVEYSLGISLNPKDLVSLTNRGEIYFKLGIFELANSDFDQAVALDTKGEDRWANRAKMLREQIRLMKQRKKK